jgi:hypothetical protein
MTENIERGDKKRKKNRSEGFRCCGRIGYD